ncbi:hypothetical protein EMIT0P100_200102 [Pseudomonas sp. IT-P100]
MPGSAMPWIKVFDSKHHKKSIAPHN